MFVIDPDVTHSASKSQFLKSFLYFMTVIACTSVLLRYELESQIAVGGNDLEPGRNRKIDLSGSIRDSVDLAPRQVQLHF